MCKKILLFFIILIQIISLSGCPGEDKSAKEEEAEQIPNTMEQAYEELDQIVTLLNGPIFGSRDMVEQLKTQQIQMLAEITADRTGKMDTAEQTGNGESDKKEGESEAGSGRKRRAKKRVKRAKNRKRRFRRRKRKQRAGRRRKENKEQENGQDKKPEEDAQKPMPKKPKKLLSRNKACSVFRSGTKRTGK